VLDCQELIPTLKSEAELKGLKHITTNTEVELQEITEHISG
jgi:hypothetical protein